MNGATVGLDAVGIAAAIREGQLSPTEAIQGAIERIDAIDGVVNAVIHRRFDQALADAQNPPNGPFRGVPILLKDLWTASAGDPCHFGMRAFKDANYVATTDSTITKRYRDAGFVLVGRTNTCEMGLVATTEPLAYGPTRNPWNPKYCTGGSSGGAAAAVAAGMVPAANASDGGGSIRIPAALCGLVGLKPSRGRVPMGPHQDEWGLSVQHALTHSVRDSAAILDATAIPTLTDSVIAPAFGQPYADQVGTDPGRLRIGVWNASPRSELELHPECQQSVAESAKLLAGLGHDVSESHPESLENRTLARHFMTLWLTSAAVNLSALGEVLGRELTKADVEPGTWAMGEAGKLTTGLAVLQAQEAMHQFRRDIMRWWEMGWDLLLTPTTLQPPPLVGDLTSTPKEPLRNSIRSNPYGAFTLPFNVTGQPAISLPLHRTSENLPVGIQLVAAYGREDLLIQVAAQLEAEVDWAATKAPLHP